MSVTGGVAGWYFTLFAPATLTLIRWPWRTNLTCTVWRCTCVPKNKLYRSRLSKVSALQTHRQTDAAKRITTAASAGGNNTVVQLVLLYRWQVVIHEALMLLRENSADETGSSSSSSSFAIVRRFIGAACNTTSLAKPPYMRPVVYRDRQPQESVV